MNKFFLVSALILSPLLTSHSQVVTGGNNYPDKDDYRLLNSKLHSLEKHLVAKDAECSKGERLLRQADLMQTYLKLTLFKNSKTDEDCHEVNRYFACLNDPKTEALVKDVTTPNAITLIMAKFKISEKEAKQVMKFYNELGVKVKD